MMKPETQKKFDKARKSLIADITQTAVSLVSKGKTKYFPDTIELYLGWEDYPTLIGYPLLNVVNNKVYGVYVYDKELLYFTNVIEHFRNGDRKMELVDLHLFETEELVAIYEYLERKNSL